MSIIIYFRRVCIESVCTTGHGLYYHWLRFLPSYHLKWFQVFPSSRKNRRPTD